MSGIEKLQGLRQKFEAKNKERPLYLQAMACSAGQLFFEGVGVGGGGRISCPKTKFRTWDEVFKT